MSWKRINNNEYYYYNIRCGNHVHTVYGGPGERGRKFEAYFKSLSGQRRLARRNPSGPADPPNGAAPPG